MLFDTHTHLNFNAFADSYREVIKECLARGMMLINVGSQYATSLRAVEIAREFSSDPIFASVGLHPAHVGKESTADENFDAEEERAFGIHAFDRDKFKMMANNSKVVAIGECGIDYYRLPENREEREKNIKEQEDIFTQHILLARELEKPLILHCRSSRNDPSDGYRALLRILQDENAQGRSLRGVVHCFIGDREIAKVFLDMGLYISFTGIITFKNSMLSSVVAEVPLERMLIETDAPYLSPEPFRGKTNYPYYVEYVARKIAEIKGFAYEEVAEVTTQNARELFLEFRNI